MFKKKRKKKKKTPRRRNCRVQKEERKSGVAGNVELGLAQKTIGTEAADLFTRGNVVIIFALSWPLASLPSPLIRKTVHNRGIFRIYSSSPSSPLSPPSTRMRCTRS